MRNIMISICSFVMVFCLLVCSFGPLAGGIVSAHPGALPAAQKFSDQELDELMGPIALYPDPANGKHEIPGTST